MNRYYVRFWLSAPGIAAGVYSLTYWTLTGITSLFAPTLPDCVRSSQLSPSAKIVPVQEESGGTALRCARTQLCPADAGIAAAPRYIVPSPGRVKLFQSALQHNPALQPQENVLGDTLFTGLVTADGEQMALLEDQKTHEGSYVAAGDYWNGWEVLAIDAQRIRLQSGKISRNIVRSEVKNFVSLNQDAPILKIPEAQANAESVIVLDAGVNSGDGQAASAARLLDAMANYKITLENASPDNALSDTASVDFDVVDLRNYSRSIVPYVY